MLPLVLARIDPPQIIGLVVVVISVLSWLVNVIQGNNPDGMPRPKQQKPKPRPSRNELEDLLQELNVEKRKPNPPPPPPRQAKPQVDRSRQKQKAPRPGAPPPYAPSRPATSRPAAPIPDLKVVPSIASIGGAVRSQHLGHRVDDAVALDIASGVEQDLGVRAPLAQPISVAVHPLVKVLRDPNGMRQAVLLNEILQRPKSLRH